MKVLVCLNNDIFSNMAFNMLYGSLARHDIEIIMSESVGKKPSEIPEIKLFENTIAFDILFPLIEKSQRENKYLTFNEFELLEGIKITRKFSLKNPDMVKYIKDYKADLMISIRFGCIFTQDIIDTPRYGILNLHSGILPDYKGILCTLQAIINDEKQVGTTLHYIEDKTIDTGSIVEISKIDVQLDKSLFWHIMNIYSGGVKSLINAVVKIENNCKISKIKQNSREGKYFGSPTRNDLIRLIEKKISLIDDITYKSLLSLYI